MQKRALTITFERSVDAENPSTMEVTLIPLGVSTNPVANTVLVGGPQTQTVLLANTTNSVVFYLVPSNHADLDDTITYRIAWRDRYIGHQSSVDFLMPNADTNFSDLAGQGNILAVR